MSRLDRAAEKFEEIAEEYSEVGRDDEREAEARMRFIDRVLFECLGWPRTAALELETTSGDASDYILCDNNNDNWVVVEAKRPSKQLANPEGSGKDGTQRFRLGGAAFNFGNDQGAWPVFTDQISKYAVEHGTRLAVATNGVQWVGAALPSRSGRPLERDFGVVFADIEAISSQFERFFNYFSLSGVRNRYLEQFLLDDQSWSIVERRRPKFVIAPGSVQPIEPDGGEDEFYRSLERALRIAFSPIEDDPEIIEKCFVESRYSQSADDRLQRLTEHLTTQLSQELERYERVVKDRAEEVEPDLATKLSGKGHLVVLSGQKSAGKTTYLRRFFGRTLEQSEKNKIRYAHVDFGRETDLHNPQDIHRVIAAKLENRIFSGDAALSQGQFFDLYADEWATHKSLYGEDDESVREFTREYRERKKERPLDYAQRLLNHAAERHGRLPCLVLDGWDHLAPVLQTAVIRSARTLFTNTFSVVTVVADDTTLWKLRNEGLDEGFSAYVTDRFWLPRPKIGEVLDNRLDYLQEVFSDQHGGDGPAARTHIGKSDIRWEFNPDELSAFLRDKVLFGSDDVRTWIGELANHNLRQVLDLAKNLVLSPVLRREEIFKAFVTGEDARALSRGRLLGALIRRNLKFFKEDHDHVVFNIFEHRVDNTFSPLAPALLLSLLDEKRKIDAESGRTIQGFMEVGDLLNRASQHLRLPEQYTADLLEWLASTEMIEAYDPSVVDVTDVNCRVKILPRGSLHLEWAIHEWGYLRQMAFTHPFVDDEAFDEVENAFSVFSDYLEESDYERAVSRAASTFVRYLLGHISISQLSGSEATRPAAEFCEALQNKWNG